MRSAPQGLGFYCITILPTVLSVIGGSADVISFLGLGLFNAHITGNLVILAAHITRFIMDLGDALLGRESADVSPSRWRAKHTWPVIAGFIAGAALGAACFAAVGLN